MTLTNAPDLHAQIMNLPCNYSGGNAREYREGYRDARHAAAELVSEHASRVESTAPTATPLKVGDVKPWVKDPNSEWPWVTQAEAAAVNPTITRNELVAAAESIGMRFPQLPEPVAGLPLQSVGPWIRSLARMPETGQLIVKRWDHNRAVWAGFYRGSAKEGSFDEWVALDAAPPTEKP
jgi:hypothetical protein